MALKYVRPRPVYKYVDECTRPERTTLIVVQNLRAFLSISQLNQHGCFGPCASACRRWAHVTHVLPSAVHCVCTGCQMRLQCTD
jgi:hypothetical protein